MSDVFGNEIRAPSTLKNHGCGRSMRVTGIIQARVLNHPIFLALPLQLFLRQILESLIVLRDAQIIHCDLKPENILLKSSASGIAP